MAIEMSGTETEARGIQGIEMGGEPSPMTGMPMTGHQSVMTIASEMTGDRFAAKKFYLFNCILQKTIISTVASTVAIQQIVMMSRSDEYNFLF